MSRLRLEPGAGEGEGGGGEGPGGGRKKGADKNEGAGAQVGSISHIKGRYYCTLTWTVTNSWLSVCIRIDGPAIRGLLLEGYQWAPGRF